MRVRPPGDTFEGSDVLVAQAGGPSDDVYDRRRDRACRARLPHLATDIDASTTACSAVAG